MIAREEVLSKAGGQPDANPTATATAAGAVSWSFASPTPATPPAGIASAATMIVVPGPMIIVQRYEYTGREFTSESAEYYFRYRVYGPALGQFLTRDPLGYVDGMGLYAGVFARVAQTDSHGRLSPWLIPIIGVPLAAAGTAVACRAYVRRTYYGDLDLARLLMREFKDYDGTLDDPTNSGAPGDALKHCLGACHSLKNRPFCCGPYDIIAIITGHEAPGTKPDQQQDLYNNNQGFIIAYASGGTIDCTTACMDKLRHHELMCLAGKQRLVPCDPSKPWPDAADDSR